MLQLIYELTKKLARTGGRDGTGGESKVLQEVLADLKIPTKIEVALLHTGLSPDFEGQVGRPETRPKSAQNGSGQP